MITDVIKDFVSDEPLRYRLLMRQITRLQMAHITDHGANQLNEGLPARLGSHADSPHVAPARRTSRYRLAGVHNDIMKSIMRSIMRFIMGS